MIVCVEQDKLTPMEYLSSFLKKPPHESILQFRPCNFKQVHNGYAQFLISSEAKKIDIVQLRTNRGVYLRIIAFRLY